VRTRLSRRAVNLSRIGVDAIPSEIGQLTAEVIHLLRSAALLAAPRPLLHRFLSLSQTPAGNGVSTLDDPLHPSISLVRPRRRLSPPRPQDAEASARRGCQGRSASGPPEGLGLECIEHDGTLAQLGSLRGLGRWLRRFPELEVATVMQHTPGDAHPSSSAHLPTSGRRR
jgi:hypothetical protein